MTLRWLDTRTEDDVAARDASLWHPVWTQTGSGIEGHTPGPREEDGEFWYAALQRVKDDPAQRFAIAQRNLPLPAAWDEMAVALRAMVRMARKEGGDTEPHLRELHQLAALWSFAVESPADRGVGYGLFEMTPYSRFAGMDLSWEKLGCDELVLLKVTDRKWMRDVWGEPPVHTTAKRLYVDLYSQISARVRELNAIERERRHERSLAQLDVWLGVDGEEAAAASQELYTPDIPGPMTLERASDSPEPSAAPHRGWLSRLLGRS